MLDASDLSFETPGQTDRLSELVMTLTHPDDVLSSRRLSADDKRAILATWASDAHAVPNLPAMRQLESGAIVSIDTVLAALRALDGAGADQAATRLAPHVKRDRRPLFARLLVPLRSRTDDDDDDPPPSPAAAASLGAGSARHRLWEPNDTAEPVAA